MFGKLTDLASKGAEALKKEEPAVKSEVDELKEKVAAEAKELVEAVHDEEKSKEDPTADSEEKSVVPQSPPKEDEVDSPVLVDKAAPLNEDEVLVDKPKDLPGEGALAVDEAASEVVAEDKAEEKTADIGASSKDEAKVDCEEPTPTVDDAASESVEKAVDCGDAPAKCHDAVVDGGNGAKHVTLTDRQKEKKLKKKNQKLEVYKVKLQKAEHDSEEFLKNKALKYKEAITRITGKITKLLSSDQSSAALPA